MTDDLHAEDEILEPPPTDDLADLCEAVHDVAFVVPAAAYDSIDTDDELAHPPAAAASALSEAAAKTVTKAIGDLGAALGGKLDALQTLFDREIRAEATREKVVDRLHAELQEYKQDLLLNVLRPVFVDLIQLHDDVGKIAEAQTAATDAVPESPRLLDLTRVVQQGIEDILYRQGVEPYSHDGETFDPRRQRAVSTVPTDDPDRNKRIAVRHRKGFHSGEKIIRPEVVSVYSHKK